MARPNRLRQALVKMPQESQDELALIDKFTSLPPIPGPKPWRDETERSAVFHCLKAAPPKMALCAAGVNLGTAEIWLSDDPPPSYKSACTALSQRLKEAEQACAAGLFANIHKAAQDPRYWTAAAWTLERKHGYVAQNTGHAGPSVVVNVGQIVVQSDGKRQLPRFEPIIDAEAIPAESLDHISSVKPQE